MPHVAAVEVIAGGIVLHLSQAQDLPAPWQGSEDRMRLQQTPGAGLARTSYLSQRTRICQRGQVRCQTDKLGVKGQVAR